MAVSSSGNNEPKSTTKITWQPDWRELDLVFGLAVDGAGGSTLLDPAAYASVAGIVGRLALAAVGDRVNKAIALSISLAAFAGLVVLLPIPSGYLMVAMIVAVMGFLGGAIMPLCLAILAEVVGPYTFASANGLASLVIALLGAVTIRLSGDIFDATGTYHAVFAMLGGAIAVGSLLMLVYARMTRTAGVAVVT